MGEGTTFINSNILAAEFGDQNQERAFQIHIVKRLRKHSSASLEMWRLHLFILSRRNTLQIPRIGIQSAKGDVCSVAKAETCLVRDPRSAGQWVEGVPWRSLSGISFHRCRQENKGQASSARTPQAPVQGGAPFQCPSHGLCGIKAF